MSTPIVPLSIFVYKIKREYEKTGKIIFPETELLSYAENVVSKASEIDNEDYWILSQNKFGLELKKKLSRICDYSYSKSGFIVNQEKFENGGSQWAEKIIGAMKYSFLKASILTLEELKEKEVSEEIKCD